MNTSRTTFAFILIILYKISLTDACKTQFYLRSLDEHKVQDKDCSQISFEKNEKLNSHLGSLSVGAVIENKAFLLHISFHDVKWRKAYLKVSEVKKPEVSMCKIYIIANQDKLPIGDVYDSCFPLNNYNESVNYLLEFKGELNTDILFKHIAFTLPTLESFQPTVPLAKRAIFISEDISSNYEIVLKIQNLPSFYNVSYYKIEVFREKDCYEVLLDVRMVKPGTSNETSFRYITYNEEGNYFFKVSPVNDVCPEDACFKTVTSKVYIRRKYPPLVIGIVGASFLIPFVLFIFHMWNRRSQLGAEIEANREKVYIVYNQTPEKHYNIVKCLEKTLKSLTNVQIVSNIAEATHIIYICGTHIFEADPSIHKFLVTEANKAISNTEIYVVSFSYSTKEIPSYLKKCLRFNLMEEFGKFVYFFNCDAEYEENAHYQDLLNQVRAAQIQTEPKKITLNMPTIIVTEQSDSSDTEPKEGDVLL